MGAVLDQRRLDVLDHGFLATQVVPVTDGDAPLAGQIGDAPLKVASGVGADAACVSFGWDPNEVVIVGGGSSAVNHLEIKVGDRSREAHRRGDGGSCNDEYVTRRAVGVAEGEVSGGRPQCESIAGIKFGERLGKTARDDAHEEIQMGIIGRRGDGVLASSIVAVHAEQDMLSGTKRHAITRDAQGEDSAGQLPGGDDVTFGGTGRGRRVQT